MLLLSSADFFFKIILFHKKRKSFGNTSIVSNGLDPEQNRRNVGSDQGPNR